MKRTYIHLLAVAFFLFALGCGSNDPDPNDPLEIAFGETAIVVVLNPRINDANNNMDVPLPGTSRAGVTVTTDEGTSHVTDARGIAVLAPVAAGMRMLTFSGSGGGGQVTVTIGDGELLEVAVASDGTTAEIMVQVDYKTDTPVEVLPTMTNSEVNQILQVSDSVVFFAGGHYVGDLDFSGSRVTLFGEGVLGGKVFLDGDVAISGSNSRIRGTEIMGTLSMTASGVGLTFSKVRGATTSGSSDAILLVNEVCGGLTVTGSGTTVLENIGAAPLPDC